MIGAGGASRNTDLEPKVPRRRSRAIAVLGLVGAWFAWPGFLTPTDPTATATPPPPTTNGPTARPSSTLIFTIAHFRDEGRRADIDVYRQPAGGLCVRLPTLGYVSCEVLPRGGRAIRISYASWVFLSHASSVPFLQFSCVNFVTFREELTSSAAQGATRRSLPVPPLGLCVQRQDGLPVVRRRGDA